MARKQQNDAPEAQAEGTDAETVTNETVLKWGDDYSVDLSTLPQSTVIALAQRGFTHILGNEVASAISARKKETVGEGDAAVLKYNDAELATMAHDMRVAKLAVMADGKLGVRASGGTRVSGIDKVMRDIAIEELKAVAAAKKKTLPRKTEELNPLIADRLAKRADAIRAKAEARMAETAELTE